MAEKNRAKIRVLQVRPSQSADLAFNAPGILVRQNYDRANGGGPAHLGESVSLFDIENDLYDKLGETDPASGGARLIYDSRKIRDTLESRFLFQQRNYTLAAALDQMIARRENSFLERFKHKDLIKAAMTKAYPEKIEMIREALNSAKTRFEALDAAYGPGEVVKEAETTTEHLQGSHIQTNGSVDVEPMAMYGGSWEAPNNIITTEIKDKDGNLSSKHETQAGGSFPHRRDGGNWVPIDGRFKSQHTESKADHHLKFRSTTPNQAFLHPKLDNKVAYGRLRAELLTQEMNESIFSHRVAQMNKILENELAALDMEVRKLQLAYAHSFLTSPMSGIVTGIFKDVGEASTIGEPVMRIENDEVILAVGLITYRDLVWVGKKADIRTVDLYEKGKDLVFPGKIVAVRGHEADNDVWDIIIECENPKDGTGKRTLPLNYTFDKDNAWVEF